MMPGARPVIGLISFVALISALLIGKATAKPGDPSLPGHHSLTQTQAGSLLISELRGVSQWRRTRFRTGKDGSGFGRSRCADLTGIPPAISRISVVDSSWDNHAGRVGAAIGSGTRPDR